MPVRVELSFPSPNVGLVQFANPPKNFIAGSLAEDVESAVLEARERCSVLVFASLTPGYFIAHAGLEGIIAGARAGRRTDLDVAHGSPFFRLMREVERGPAITIAANNGQAWGGGAEFNWACDLRIAAESATYGQPETLLGIIPGAGGTTRLARLIGPARCLEMVLDGGPITAQTALDWGAVHRVVPDERLLPEALAWAERLAQRPAWALALAKRSVVEGRDLPLDQAMRNEFSLYGEAATREGSLKLLEAAQQKYDDGADSYEALNL